MIPRVNTINSVTIGGINYPYIIDGELWSTTEEKEKAIKDMANEAGWGKWSIDKVRDDDGNMFTKDKATEASLKKWSIDQVTDDKGNIFKKVCDLATSSCFLIAAGTLLAAAAVKSGYIGGKKKTIKSKRKTHKKLKTHKKTKSHKKYSIRRKISHKKY
jgi:hypothetical protein